MKNLFVCLAVILSLPAHAETPYTDRFVWIFGWRLDQDGDVAAISRVLDSSAPHGINGAVVSLGLDSLCKKKPEYFRRLDEVLVACKRNQIEIIPAVFGTGYGGEVLAHNNQLAEGLPVEDAPFLVSGGEARLVRDESVSIANGGFEEFSGNQFHRYSFHDQPGQISFVDTGVQHGGNSSLRMQNFKANPHGHGRVMQEIRVIPHRCYRVSLWVKTEDLRPAGVFKISVLTTNRTLAPVTIRVPPTSDWRKWTFLFNSLSSSSVRLYAGVWGGTSGTFWLDDWEMEEMGPINVLHRPGTPVTVRSEDGARVYEEGRDFEPLLDPAYTPFFIDRTAPPLKLTRDSRIQDGQRLQVSWFHPMSILEGQISLCMAEPEVYEIFDHEAKQLAERLHPKRVLLNMDEIRMGGTCRACRGRNMGELLGECVTKQMKILRKYMPDVEVLIWSDMFDPNHNAREDYYLVEGNYNGSWKHLPKDLTLVVWGDDPREKSLRFLADEGFRTMVACYYDADNLRQVQNWLDFALTIKNVRGFMYTSWQKKYNLLPAFGDLVSHAK